MHFGEEKAVRVSAASELGLAWRNEVPLSEPSARACRTPAAFSRAHGDLYFKLDGGFGRRQGANWRRSFHCGLNDD